MVEHSWCWMRMMHGGHDGGSAVEQTDVSITV